MVADELAISLADRFVPTKSKILDPFCGTGRMLAAAKNASVCVGFDANPLACLLTEAKFALADSKRIRHICDGLRNAQASESYNDISFPIDRKVDWFSPSVAAELGRIIGWINRKRLARPELLIVASALSATARQVSFARNSGWKLHRMGKSQRKKFQPCAWSVFEKRLKYCVAQLKTKSPTARAHVACGDAKNMQRLGKSFAKSNFFDVVLTSPPYGDSRTTVQYGAASSLCLAVISRLRGLSHLAIPGCDIDNACLGGLKAIPNEQSMKSYWAGGANNRLGKTLSRFLGDYDLVCGEIAKKLRVGGKAIFVVGRRSTGGFRLMLDRFTIDCFKRRGFRLVKIETRELKHKRIPRSINRYARSKRRKLERSARTVTMNSEIIVVLKKLGKTSPRRRAAERGRSRATTSTSSAPSRQRKISTARTG
jgi:site-specific DNA-methyltransferase (cytosine-N4-specific)